MNKVTVIKRYANRKHYNTRTSRHVTLTEIIEMVGHGEDVLVLDNRSKVDITARTLTQAINEARDRRGQYHPVENLRRIIQDMQGFGLVELMVCTAILSVVLAGIMQATYLSMLQAQTNDVKNAVSSINGSTGMLAIDQTSCTQAITKTSQQYATDVRFDLPDGSVIAAGSAPNGYPINVRRFQYINPTLTATGFDGTKVYYGSLVLSLGTTKQVIGPQVFAPRTIANVYLTVSPAGTVTQCGSQIPQLPQAPAAPAPRDPAADPQFGKACGQIGGTMVGSACTFPQPDTRPGEGNGDDNHEHEGDSHE